MQNFIFVGHYWGDKKYADLAHRWKHSLSSLKIPYDVVHVHNPPSYQYAINNKPRLILSMLNKYKNKGFKGLVYMDIDMKVNKYPHIFKNDENYDFMAFNWNYDPKVTLNNAVDPYILELPGGLMYFAINELCINVVKKWMYSVENKNKLRADDRVLAMVFYENSYVDKLRVNWLPVEYFHISELFETSGKNSTIIHDMPLTSEEQAYQRTGVIRNRVPPSYKIHKSVRNKTNYSLLSNMYPQLKNRLIKHGFHMENLNKIKKSKQNFIAYLNTTVTPSEMIDALYKNMIICIQNYEKKPKRKDFDIYCPTYNKKTHKFNYIPSRICIYLKNTDVVSTILKKWSTSRDLSIKGLYDVLNSNASYILQSRICTS